MEKETPKYTTIIHKIRIELDLTCNEYCVADIIFSLSNNPDAKVLGWCFATKETIAGFMGISKKVVHEIINRLIGKELVEKDPESKYLKTTSLWYQSVILERLKMKNIDRNEKSLIGTKGVYVRHERCLQTDTKGVTYNNKYYKDTYKEDIILHTDAEASGKEVNEIIDLFKEINPSYNQLFKRKPQREAVARLLEKMGQEKLSRAVAILERTNTMKYAPIITTPIQLEEKLGNLMAFLKKEQLNPNVIKL